MNNLCTKNITTMSVSMSKKSLYKMLNMKKSKGLLYDVIYKILKSSVYSSYSTPKTKFYNTRKIYWNALYRKQSKTWIGKHGSFIDHHS